jgi:hypothetical protein
MYRYLNNKSGGLIKALHASGIQKCVQDHIELWQADSWIATVNWLRCA